MAHTEFPLTKQEQLFKQYYQGPGRHLLDKGMSYQEYRENSCDADAVDGFILQYHEAVTANNQAHTVIDPGQLGMRVEIVRHARYAWPVLHDHAYIEMAYVYDGECTHFINDQTFPMKKGDVCIMSPTAIHSIAAASDDAIIINFLMSRKLFDQSFLGIVKGDKLISRFLENILFQRSVSPYLLFHTGDDPWMQETVLRVYREHEKRDYLFEDSVQLYVKQIFIHLIRHYQMMAVVSDPISANQDNHVVALIGYITVNYNKVTLKDVAAFFGYNETYLGQMLQKYTGKSFRMIINELQMEHAKAMLEAGNRSITDIGMEVGCYDASHFNRKFKAMYGMTPRAYQKQLLEDRTP